MADVRPGRWTAEIDGDFVVFLIGARVSWRHPIRSFKDLGGTRGMTHMLKHLEEHPERGLLGYEMAGLGTIIVQYWRSFDDLERFARDRDDPHLEVWRRYVQRTKPGAVGGTGIWHETYLVRAGEYEAIYGNMPPFGLGKAADLVPLAEASAARGRLRTRAAAETR